jgi:hypothetical protein
MIRITILKLKQGMQITKKSDLTNMFRLHHSERHLRDQYHPVHIPVHITVTTCVSRNRPLVRRTGNIAPTEAESYGKKLKSWKAIMKADSEDERIRSQMVTLT